MNKPDTKELRHWAHLRDRLTMEPLAADANSGRHQSRSKMDVARGSTIQRGGAMFRRSTSVVGRTHPRAHKVEASTTYRLPTY